MDTKHSPGPWLTDRNNVHAGQIATIHHCLNNDWVEVWTDTWCFEDTPLDEERQEANACLIATAPELLEALQRTTEMCEAYADWIKRNVMSATIEEHPYLPELEGAAEDARAAIAKATGSAP